MKITAVQVRPPARVQPFQIRSITLCQRHAQHYLDSCSDKYRQRADTGASVWASEMPNKQILITASLCATERAVCDDAIISLCSYSPCNEHTKRT